MSSEIGARLLPEGGAIDAAPSDGVLAAKLLARDVEGKTLIEFVLPDQLPGGPEVPFEASWWTVEPGEVTPRDVHDVQEVWLVARGSGNMRLGQREIEIAAGQIVYVPPRQEHEVRATGTETLTVFSIWW